MRKINVVILILVLLFVVGCIQESVDLPQVDFLEICPGVLDDVSISLSYQYDLEVTGGVLNQYVIVNNEKISYSTTRSGASSSSYSVIFYPITNEVERNYKPSGAEPDSAVEKQGTNAFSSYLNELIQNIETSQAIEQADGDEIEQLVSLLECLNELYDLTYVEPEPEEVIVEQEQEESTVSKDDPAYCDKDSDCVLQHNRCEVIAVNEDNFEGDYDPRFPCRVNYFSGPFEVSCKNNLCEKQVDCEEFCSMVTDPDDYKYKYYSDPGQCSGYETKDYGMGDIGYTYGICNSLEICSC